MTDRELSYLIENTSELEGRYSGMYIAIHEQKVIAKGRTIHEVYRKTDRKKVKEPLITYVPRSGEELLLI